MRESSMQLFAHNHMIREAMALDPLDTNTGTGVGGRLLDILKRNGYQTSGNTVDGQALLNAGDKYYGNAESNINTGTFEFMDKLSSLGPNMLEIVKKLNGIGESGNNMLGETCSELLSRSLSQYETDMKIDIAIKNGDFNMDGYKDRGGISSQFRATAQYMKARHLRSVDREVFFVHQGG